MLRVKNIQFSIEHINSKTHYLDQEVSSLLPPFGPVRPDLTETNGGTAIFWELNPKMFACGAPKYPLKYL